MKINWITKCKNWAFYNQCKKITAAMPNHVHSFDDKDGDINFVCSSNFFKRGISADSRTILLIPSFRVFGDNIEIITESKNENIID